MRKKILIIYLSIFLFSFTYINAQSDPLGCCTNPGAGTLTCSSDRLVLNTECCPKPEANFTSYYKSPDAPNNPNNSIDCTQNFFFQNQACAGVNECALGCCCSDTGYTIKPEAQCKATGLKFFKGQINCQDVCKIPQCSDGIDNDNNGCLDFGKDTGCDSASDNDESNGYCIKPGNNCNDPTYLPNLTLEIAPVKGQKKFLLTWLDECKSSSLFYEISRCEGLGCTNYEQIAVVKANSFEDAAEELGYGITYTYKLKAFYSTTPSTPLAFKAATLGDLQCLGRTDASMFCFNNSGFYCNSANKLIPEGTKCSSTQVCVISSNKPSCFPKSKCNFKESNPFGLYSTQQNCETRGYCFYDRSHSTVNNCFTCDPSMDCYDYKTEQSCKSNNCQIGSCEWKPLSSQLELGVCVNKNTYNCQWCDKKGTATLENINSYNTIFDACTKDKSMALSTGSFKCYFRNGKSTSCSNMACTDYSPEQCNSAQITLDQYNNIQNPSNDECGIQVCQKISNVCVKNADGDGKADCNSINCEKDYFAPNTLLLSTTRKNAVDDILVQVYDKTGFNGSQVLRSDGYATYLCLEPCGQNGHPYNLSTNATRLIVSNLNVFDSRNGNKLFNLNEGSNTIRYYSQDPSKNLGKVKQFSFEAHFNTTGPKVFSINVTDGNVFYDKIYSNNLKPNISIRFYEPAVVTFSRLINKKTGFEVPLTTSSGLGTTASFILSNPLPIGEYTFELNAKSSNNVFMDPIFSAVIVLDNSTPILNISPSNNEVIENPLVTIKLTFNKEVRLEKVMLDSKDIKDLFSTINNKIFIATLNLTDGNKVIEVAASDFTGNKVSKSASFIVDSEATKIFLIKPKFGIAPTYTFDLIVGTDNNANCKYSFKNNFEYDFMDSFDSTGSTSHKVTSFNKIANGDKGTYKLYVKCKDPKYGETSNVFDLSVDNTPPEIKQISALPNPVVEEPKITMLSVETDELAICKYSNISSSYSNMEGKFIGFDEEEYKIINKQNITLNREGDFTYYVVCENKAGATSSSKQISLSVKLNASLQIISRTQEFFNSTNIFLSVETNKKSQCKYSETDPEVQTGEVFGPPGYFHKADIISSNGRHTFYVICKDQYQQKFSDVLRIIFTVDLTPPEMLSVDDTSTLDSFPEKSCFTDKLRVKFLGEDPESMIKEYYYTIVEKQNNQMIVNVTKSTSGNQWIWVNNLDLENNTEYFFAVNAKNYAGFDSEIRASDGVTVDTSTCDSLNLTCKDRGDCEIGAGCSNNYECKTRFCNNGLCTQATCTDSFKNQEESDVDCGGSCNKCQNEKFCNNNNDCLSGNCNYGICKTQDTCSDGIFSGNEADVDCGGPCQEKCGNGQSCNINDDCEAGLQCISAQCKSPEQPPGEKDSDGDGMPDDWEIQNGLNPNDPNDASADFDNDGLTNYEEYNVQRTYSRSSDPNNIDTDNDGFSDKVELDKGTNPVDAEDFPKSSKTKIILFMVGMLVLISGFGYLGYVAIQKRREAEFEMPKQRETPKSIQRQVQQQPAQFIPPREVRQTPPMFQPRPLAKEKEALKDMERKRLFEPFGKETKEQPKQEIKEKKEEKPRKKRVIRKTTTKKPRQSKTKEDVFIKLKEMAKEAKKKK